MRPWPVARCCSRPRWKATRTRLVEIHGAGRVHRRDLARAVADDRVRTRRPSAARAPASAAWNAKFTGCAKSASATRDAASSFSSSSTSDHSAWRRISRSHSSMTARNTGSRLEQLAPHAPPLRAHAREDERDAAAGACVTRVRSRRPRASRRSGTRRGCRRASRGRLPTTPRRCSSGCAGAPPRPRGREAPARPRRGSRSR